MYAKLANIFWFHNYFI